jgi:hypothetical protein
MKKWRSDTDGSSSPLSASDHQGGREGDVESSWEETKNEISQALARIDAFVEAEELREQEEEQLLQTGVIDIMDAINEDREATDRLQRMLQMALTTTASDSIISIDTTTIQPSPAAAHRTESNYHRPRYGLSDDDAMDAMSFIESCRLEREALEQQHYRHYLN